MSAFEYKDNVLHVEDTSLAALAEKYGTPLYVYSKNHFVQQFKTYADALTDVDHLVCFAVKSNSNIAVLNVLAQEGAGFDIVSIGELERVIAAGGDPSKVVFSGVAKSRSDMKRALEAGIHCFNVESVAELKRLQEVAEELMVSAPVSLRVNPDVDAGTHPYISTGLKSNKFGIPIAFAKEVYLHAKTHCPNIRLVGVDCHIGSQLTTLSPFLDALDRVLLLVDALAEEGVVLEHLDLGGGLGVTYTDELPPSATEYVAAVRAKLAENPERPALKLIFEPGRYVSANAGVLLTTVEYLKLNDRKQLELLGGEVEAGEVIEGGKHFVVVDAGMNDLIRPSLYQAHMHIQPVVRTQQTAAAAAEGEEGVEQVVSLEQEEAAQLDVVGPVCETGCFLGKDRSLPLSAVQEGAVLAVMSAGAYGFVMASNYNTRGRPAEILVDGEQAFEVRKRETVTSLFEGESVLPKPEQPKKGFFARCF